LAFCWALEEDDYRRKLARAGVEQIDIEPTRVYRVEEARDFLRSQGVDVDAIALQANGKLMSAFVRATRPPAVR
jgi:transcriptional regulator GlxA family with amidase domain